MNFSNKSCSGLQKPFMSHCFDHIYLFTELCFSHSVSVHFGARGGAVVEALRFKPEGRGINSRCFHWNFSLI
jgi:hypothetical protein